MTRTTVRDDAPKKIVPSGYAAEQKIVPLGNKILVKRMDKEDRSKGGILLPDMAKEAPQIGQVIAVGPGKVNDAGVLVAMNVREQDQVMFSKYAGNEVEINQQRLLIMSEDDILAKIIE